MAPLKKNCVDLSITRWILESRDRKIIRKAILLLLKLFLKSEIHVPKNKNFKEKNV